MWQRPTHLHLVQQHKRCCCARTTHHKPGLVATMCVYVSKSSTYKPVVDLNIWYIYIYMHIQIIYLQMRRLCIYWNKSTNSATCLGLGLGTQTWQYGTLNQENETNQKQEGRLTNEEATGKSCKNTPAHKQLLGLRAHSWELRRGKKKNDNQELGRTDQEAKRTA